MSKPDVIRPFKLGSALDLSASFNSSSTVLTFMIRCSIAVNMLTSSSAVGNFKLQGRVSLSAAGYPTSGPSTEWIDIANTSTAAPAAGASIGWDIPYTGWSEIRVVYTRTSGSGTCDIWIAAKGA